MQPPPLILPILLLVCSCSSSLAFSSLRRTSAAVSFRKNLHAISDSGDAERQQKGMDEAFASLDKLTPSDWDDAENVNSKDKGYESQLKHCRTDETGASNTGKATREEVEHYLDMTTELDGTAVVQHTEEESNEDEVETIDQINPITDEEDTEEDADINNHFPWESINPILRLRGQVATGYGRGGKKLGVPTANLPASLFQSALEDVSTGVYFGWAVIEGEKQGRGPIKAVVNVGYSPTFEGKENKEKIVEAHLITKSSPMAAIDDASITANVLDQGEESDIIEEISDDFYGQTMRLQLIGFLRPEQKFESFPDLIAQIHRDIGLADIALKSMPFIFSKEDAFIQDKAEWVGSGGGDDIASWEFETW